MAGLFDTMRMGGVARLPLYDAIQAVGETGDLKLCLDAGDALSAPAGTTKWLDRSVGGYDFWLGLDGTATADPAFVGTPGGLGAEHWLFNGASYLKYDSATEAWMNNLHKAGAKFTILAAVRVVAGSAQLIGNNGGTGVQIGCGLFATGTSPNFGLLWYVAMGSPPYTVANFASSGTYAAGDHLLALSVDTVAGTGFMWCDGSYLQVDGSDTFSATYTNPSAAGATKPFYLGCQDHDTGNKSPDPNGERFHGVAIWEGRAITKASLDALYANYWIPRFT